MKALTSLKPILMMAFCAAMLFCDAQQRQKCGPYKVDKAALAKALDYEKTHNTLAPSFPITLMVFFQICEPDGGGSSNITESMLQTEIDHLAHAYGPNNICFLNGGYSYIYSTALDTFNFSTNDKSLFNPYRLSNCITIFLIDHLGGSNGSDGGGASGVTFGPLPTAWTIVEKDYVNLGTTEHEVGHCLGLLHTFDFNNGNGLEDIDESNGKSSADLVDDTYADPFVFAFEDKKNCYAEINCTYTGNCTDPKGNPNYTPPYTNLMSYWCLGWYPTYTVTTGQYVRINSFLNTASVLQNCESQTTVVENSNTYSSGIHINSATNTLTTNGSVTFSNTVNATLGAGGTVFLEPGFDAFPSINGKVSIRTTTCYSGFATAQKLLAVENKNTVTGNLIAYPNPAINICNLKFILHKNESSAAVDIYDMNSKKVKTILFKNLNAGKNIIPLKLNGLSSGIYAVVLRYSDKLMLVKVMVEHN